MQYIMIIGIGIAIWLAARARKPKKIYKVDGRFVADYGDGQFTVT